MKSPIKHLFISAVLFLPLCFFIWFYAASILVLPVKWLLDFALQFWQADLFNGIEQTYYMLKVETLIFPAEVMPGNEDKIAVLDVAVNPMIYGYGIAVFSGLVMSIPDLSWQKKLLQIICGYVMVVLVQAFGCFWQTTKTLMLSAGQDAQQAILDTGINPELVAAMYQLSYLILPAVAPIVLWILLNRRLIESLTHFAQQEENKELSSDDQV